jgi:hypothetical protein
MMRWFQHPLSREFVLVITVVMMLEFCFLRAGSWIGLRTWTVSLGSATCDPLSFLCFSTIHSFFNIPSSVSISPHLKAWIQTPEVINESRPSTTTPE